MEERLFCEIYVDASEDDESFTEKIHLMLSGERSGYELDSSWATIDVLENDEYSEEFGDPGSEFLGYRYRLEFEFEDSRGVTREEYVIQTGELLTKLWGVTSRRCF